MPYLNVDDGMDEHPKVDAVSDAAFRLHMSGMLYCARKLTDGFIPLAKARRLTVTGGDGIAGELVRAGLWHDLGEGCTDPACIEERTCQKDGRAGHYIVHDYLQWNHSKVWWDKRRAADTERKRKWRATKDTKQNERVTPSVPSGHDAGRTTPEDAGLVAPEPDQTPDTRTNPLAQPLAVDGRGSVTELQTARAKRAKSESARGGIA